MTARMKTWNVFLSLLGIFACVALQGADPASIRGKVSGQTGILEGAYVAARASGSTIIHYVMTDSSGQFVFRNLAPGTYEVYTQIPGFHTARKEGVSAQQGKAAIADFQVEVETDPKVLVEQASNSELMESFPGTKEQKSILVGRCDGCHGAYYFAKTRFTHHDWLLIIAKMKGTVTTPIGDVAPPVARSRPVNPMDAGDENYFVEGQKGAANSDSAIADYLSSFRGPDSPPVQIKFQPRATGALTRAIVTEYQLPRRGSTPHDVQLDPNGRYVWYDDWKANYIGRVDIKTGEIKEYAVPGTSHPGGFLTLVWGNNGELWGGQLWSGRAVRFNTRTQEVTGEWEVPQEWARTGSVGLCRNQPNAPVWVDDALTGNAWTLDPQTGKYTPRDPKIKGSRFACDSKGTIYSLARGNVLKTDPGTNKVTAYKIPSPGADPHRLTLDAAENVWYGDWDGGKMGYLDTKTGKITEFSALTPWSHMYNAIGDTVHQVGWTVPWTDRMMKADLKTGQVTEFPLPSRGHSIRVLDINMSTNPPTIWFVNQRMGRIVSFQEFSE